jgi:hypothetical protein
MKHELPIGLKTQVQKEIGLNLKGTSIAWKFLFFQILGALFSLALCPQFGLGLVSGHGISHIFRMIGDWACAGFCGTLFLSSGMITAFIGMKGEELWWVWRRFKYSLVLLPPLLWGSLMMFQLQTETLVFHVIWILSAIITQSLWLKVREGLYLQSLKT